MAEDLLSLEGIGRKKAQALRDAGFDSVDDVRRASVEELSDAEGVGAKLAENIKRQAEALKTSLAPETHETETFVFAGDASDDVEAAGAAASGMPRARDMPSEPEPMPSSSERGFHVTPLVAVFMAAVFVGGALLGGFVGYWTLSGDVDDLRQKNDALQEQLSSLGGPSHNITYFFGNTSLSSLYREVRNSIVVIQAYIEQQSMFGTQYAESQGSGFVYNYSGQHVVVTNYHVVRDAVNITVRFCNGTTYTAGLLGADPYADLAILEPHAGSAALQPLPVADSAALEVGDPVVAIGNPFGLTGSMTTGIVSHLGRTIRESAAGNFPIANIIQISTPINPGNSGGPLLNYRGEVVGITTAIIQDSQGVGFAIPSDTVLREVPALVTEGGYDRHSWLGVTGIDMTYQLAMAMNVSVTYGWLIATVVDGSPADKAGIQGGDRQAEVGGQQVVLGGDIIIAVDGHRVVDGDDLMSYLEAQTSPGDSIELTVMRDGEHRYFTVTLEKRPPPS
ncbi:MAG: trypsin-like peptidase domain-containing protein [Thermoplasmatota archaeon]